MSQHPIDPVPCPSYVLSFAERRAVTAAFDKYQANHHPIQSASQLESFILGLGVNLCHAATVRTAIQEHLASSQPVTLELALSVLGQVKTVHESGLNLLNAACDGSEVDAAAPRMFRALADTSTGKVSLNDFYDALLAAGLRVNLHELGDAVHVDITQGLSFSDFQKLMAQIEGSSATAPSEADDDVPVDIFNDEGYHSDEEGEVGSARSTKHLGVRKATRRVIEPVEDMSVNRGSPELDELQRLEEKRLRQLNAKRIAGADGLTDFQRRRLLRSFRVTQPLSDIYGTRNLFKRSSNLVPDDHARLQALYEPLQTGHVEDLADKSFRTFRSKSVARSAVSEPTSIPASRTPPPPKVTLVLRSLAVQSSVEESPTVSRLTLQQRSHGPRGVHLIAGPNTVTIANHDAGTAKVLKLPPLKPSNVRELYQNPSQAWRVNYADFVHH